ncbi:Fragile X mental retardation protein 1, partial [Fasciola hepatica]
AVLCNVVNDEAVVSYPQSQQEEHVRLTEVRLPPSGSGNVSVGQGAEVLFSVQETPGGDSSLSATVSEDPNIQSASGSSYKANHLELPAWWPCHVQRVRDDVAVVKLDVKPLPNASPADQAVCSQLSTITDIVNRVSLRQSVPDANSVPDASHLTSDTILRHCIEIPKELADFASDTTVHAEFVKHCGGPTSLFYDAEAGCLVVLSTDKDTIDNVVLLEDTHLKMLRQKWAITQGLRQTMRTLEVNRGPENLRSTVAHSRSSGDWDSDPSVVVEKFYVPQRLMGLAIGYHGANIRAAREIPGVISVRVRETSSSNWRGGTAGVDAVCDNEDAALIIVEAKNAEAAKQARAKLEFVDLYLGVPQRYVARLIGRRTANILSVVDKSGVVSIHLDNETQCPSDEEEVLNIGHLDLNYPGPPSSDMRRIFLRAGSSQAVTQPPTDERYCGFILSGTRDSVEKARLLINFQLDYIYDLEKLEENNLEIMRSLGSDGGVGHTARGYPDGPGRFGGGGRGMNRGGSSKRPTGRGGQNYSQGSTVDNSFNSNHPSEREANGAYAYATGRRPVSVTPNAALHRQCFAPVM